jgi:hypothetical protein
MVGTPLTVGIGLQADAVAFPAVVCRTYELMILVETLGSRYAISAKWTSEMGVKTILRTDAAPGPLFLPNSGQRSRRSVRLLCAQTRNHACKIGALTGGLPVVRDQALY